MIVNKIEKVSDIYGEYYRLDSDTGPMMITEEEAQITSELTGVTITEVYHLNIQWTMEI